MVIFLEFSFPNYQSGMFELVSVVGLKEGESYSFRATAMNIYGTSGAANSIFVDAGKLIILSLSLSLSLSLAPSPGLYNFSCLSLIHSPIYMLP